MKPINITLLRVLSAGLIAGAALAPALAQSAPGGFDKPLKGGKGETAQAGSSSTTVMRQDDGENSYEVRISNGKTTAKVNGKEVPEDRVVRDGDQIKIVGKDGQTLTTFQTPTVAKQGEFRQRTGRAPRAMRIEPPQTPEPPQAESRPERPKVMVGIYMEPANEDQLKEADLEGAEAIFIQGVVPGLPAEKAGTKEGDLITEIDGQKPATQETLRDALMSKKPGDTVTLTVHRENGDKAIRVKLEKYNPDVLPMNKPQGMGGPDSKAMEDAMKDWQKGLPKGWPGDTIVLPGPEGRIQLMTPGGKTDERLAELDKRMAELDEKLSKLNEQMAKIEELVEKMSKHKE